MASLAEEFSDNVGFLTILIDFEMDREAAIRITDSVDASFITVNASPSLVMSFGNHFASGSIPESLLIDEDGNIIERIVGGSSDDYRVAIENALALLAE